jgi:hypothetical protein
VVSPDLLSPTPTSSAMKTLENTEEDPDDLEPADQGAIQMEYSFRQFKYRSSNKKLPVRA